MKKSSWSLRSHLIFTLLIASLLYVYFTRNRWELFEIKTNPMRVDGSLISPDNTRILDSSSRIIDIYQRFEGDENPYAMQKKTPLFRVYFQRSILAYPLFIDNDTIVVMANRIIDGCGEYPANTYVTFKRRFPEWWWGHMFRPPVWIALVCLVLLILSLRQDWIYVTNRHRRR